MKPLPDSRFELQPVLRSALPDVAAFLHKWRSSEAGVSPTRKPLTETVGSIERRLRWLLVDNPVAAEDSTLGYCVRDALGVVRGINLSFPVAFRSANQTLLGLCSGSFFVERPARSLGFYLFKKYLATPGYSFYFASTCNTNSSVIWRSMGGSPVPHSETEYILPLRLDGMIPSYMASRTSNQAVARIARTFGRSANPLLRLLTRPSMNFELEPCHDWEKLSELSRRHCAPDHITSDRSPALLQWRYGPGSPSDQCAVYLFRDEQGNEGWFSLGNFTRGEAWQCRASVLLEVIWPREQMTYSSIFQEILRVTAAAADAIFFRWQPGLDCGKYRRFVVKRKLRAPRAFVSLPKGAPYLPLDSLDYDDSDYLAWGVHWTDE